MTRALRPATLSTLLSTLLSSVLLCAQSVSAPDSPPQIQEPQTILRTTVRRVVLDVVVTDPKGAPVPALTKDDFSIDEDGKPQRILSFDPNGFDAGMDYTPPKLPPQPPNTFINLPATPEKGPLYVLLYDLNNMDNEDQMALTANQHPDQMFGRQQLLKFIRNKPEGSRFEIYVWSDRLHLLQGFTSDKAKLYAVVDPKHPGPHIPQVYLMGQNTGRGNSDASLAVLNQIGASLDGLPGRKNLIWFSGQFPVQLFPTNLDGDNYIRESKATLDLLARNQIAIYPVDVRGVVYPNWKSLGGLSSEGAIVSQRGEGGGGSSGGGSGASAGISLLSSSYGNEDEIARETGGRAFYSNNDVAGALSDALKSGASYYTLTYSPTNHDYDGKLRRISVALERKGYTLDYRRSYYATASPAELLPPTAKTRTVAQTKPEAPKRAVGDTLSANMQHGAPTAHDLLFQVRAKTDGAPIKATQQQMAELTTEPAFFRLRRKVEQGKPVPPVPLQKYVLTYEIPTRQFSAGSSLLHLEVAAAAYDAEGQLLNALVNVGTRATRGDASNPSDPVRLFRVEQELQVPAGATSLRFAVRDTTTDRLGAMEIDLPLEPEGQSASATATPAH